VVYVRENDVRRAWWLVKFTTAAGEVQTRRGREALLSAKLGEAAADGFAGLRRTWELAVAQATTNLE